METKHIVNVRPQHSSPYYVSLTSGTSEEQLEQHRAIEDYCSTNSLEICDSFSQISLTGLHLQSGDTLIVTDLRIISKSVEELSEILYAYLQYRINIIPIAQDHLISLWDFAWLENNGYLDTDDRIRRDVKNVAKQALFNGV